MADEEHLKMLQQGVTAWNQWRIDNRVVGYDLSYADLSGANLIGADLSGWPSSSDIGLRYGSSLLDTKLSGALLNRANLSGASLLGTDLSDAVLVAADLSETIIMDVDLRKADLRFTNLSFSCLQDCDVTDSTIGFTIFANTTLNRVHGLETVHHAHPSEIGINTFFYRSEGGVPDKFLRGAGAPENFIAYMHSLAITRLEFYSCFISHSSQDKAFADRLYTDLQSKGVRCWFAPEDLKIGDKLRPSFDNAIRSHDKLMVVFSESSVKSPWVEKEVEAAFEKERQQERTVLFPIRLDDAVMDTGEAWAADIRRTRHIGDFRDWTNHDLYKRSLDCLLRDLKAEGTF